MKKLTADYVCSILDYCPETGVFTWKYRNNIAKEVNTQFAHKEAGCIRRDGYLIIGIDCKLYLAHRLAWLWMTGEWPEYEIDHKDLNKSNLKWNNLRLATHAQNSSNHKIRRNNTSGFKGVYWNKAAQKWQAYISSNKIYKYLGLFDTAEDANIVRLQATEKLHGEFASIV